MRNLFKINLRSTPKFTRPELLYWPGIPPPLQGVNPRTIMGKVNWDVVRAAVYDKNNDCCWACGVHRSKAQPNNWLEAHELYDISYKKARMKLREIVALCPMCHKYVHKGRLLALVEAGKRQQKFYDRVVAHGDAILTRTRAKPWFDAQKLAEEAAKYKHPWRKWHLKWRGKKYYSRFKTFDEYLSYYARLGTKR